MNLLKGLETTARNELEGEIKSWKEAGKLLKDTLQDFTSQKNTQSEKCVLLKSKIAELKIKIKSTETTIADNTETIETQKKELQDLLNQRCEATKVYINSLKNNRDALRLFNIIRKAIKGFNPALLDVSELKSVLNRFGNFINIYAKDHSEVFSQIMYDVNGVHERTSIIILL